MVIPSPLQAIFQSLDNHQPLCEASAAQLLEAMLVGELATPAIAHALTRIHERGVNVDELVGGARALRARALPLPITTAQRAKLLDTCGTGGGPKAFNISTLSAIVAATAGNALAPHSMLVAKHGNRSRTGRGSAEILASLGVHVDATPQQQAACLRDASMCFCFAIHHHGAVRHAREARQSLPFPTIFNALGPLSNPASAPMQVLGAYDATLAHKLALALQRLGSQRALTLHASNGMDELSLSCETRLWCVSAAAPDVREATVSPSDLASWGVHPSSVESVQAADLAHATTIATSVLRGEPSPYAEWTIASAALALLVATQPLHPGESPSDWLRAHMPSCVARCREVQACGACLRTLDALARASKLDEPA
jgi:anthranilate phosphoribosyltransferase